jgi:mRNA interferase MazF
MPDFSQGSVIRVPFPYTDRSTRQRRPALVVSEGGLGENQQLLWVVMITSADNRRWSDDVDLTANHREVGLPAPSLIRPSKIATIELADAEWLGQISSEQMQQVALVLRQQLTLR